jgi:acetoin utilization deacetylase AcuC-like enzyme
VRKKSLELVYSPVYDLSDYTHVLAAGKYRMLYDELKLSRWHWHTPQRVDEATLRLVHTERYLKDFLGAKLTDKTLRAEVPIDERIVNAVCTATQGTILAAELALQYGTASNLSGGFHHAFADHAEGFCFVNDIAVAIMYLRQRRPGLKVAIIDLDVHQGNGTAYILRKDENSYTFSMHEKDNYPKKERGSQDVDLPSFIGDDEYLETLDKNLEILRRRFIPDLIFYIAGVDVYRDDMLGGLHLSFEGIGERDRRIRDFMPEVPLVVLPAGGYARNLHDTVKLHAQTIEILHGRLD